MKPADGMDKGLELDELDEEDELDENPATASDSPRLSARSAARDSHAATLKLYGGCDCEPSPRPSRSSFRIMLHPDRPYVRLRIVYLQVHAFR